jgi:hypothetical protein
MLVFLLLSTLFQIPLRKWACMDPIYIENGPTWLRASISACWPALWFIVAFLLKGNEQEKYASMAAAFAFGASIGHCFSTFSNSSGIDIQRSNLLARWYITIWEGFGDSIYKAIIVSIVAIPLKYFFNFNIFFLVSVTLAFLLLIKKTLIAVVDARDPDTAPDLQAAKDRMLIGSNVILTMICGVVSLGLWLLAVTPLMGSFKPLVINDYVTVISYVLGVGLHFR